jgi:hypothetical protein
MLLSEMLVARDRLAKPFEIALDSFAGRGHWPSPCQEIKISTRLIHGRLRKGRSGVRSPDLTSQKTCRISNK